MNIDQNNNDIQEYEAWHAPIVTLFLPALILVVIGAMVVPAMLKHNQAILLTCLCFAVLVIITCCIHTVLIDPNEAVIVERFGNYIGTVRDNGWFLIAPFTTANKISLKHINFTTDTLKVNDKNGNPVEIGAVIVYHISDTARAFYEVDNANAFAQIQSETALRHVASLYAYDSSNPSELTLSGNSPEIIETFVRELNDRLAPSGLTIDDARIAHLAYATEVASAMLQKQQSSAVLAARNQIVNGAVHIAEHAIGKLQSDTGIRLTQEQTVKLLDHILVCIISNRDTQPTIDLQDNDQ